MSDFKPFGQAISKRFEELSRGELFVVSADPDLLWDAYLAAFPPGTNKVYRTRREHECSCCKNFIRNLGAVVSIAPDGSVGTLWDVPGLESPYREVAQALHEHVRALPVASVFRTKESSYGAPTTRELCEDKSVRTWDHFHGAIERKHMNANAAQVRGEINIAAQMLRRALIELKPEAVDTVLSLINQNALYRGAEHRAAVVAFRELQQRYLAITEDHALSTFGFMHASSPAARFRNTVIGTLVQDLSDGMELEAAVRSFETKVAPTNYKRTTALITPRMVQDAMAKIEELGLRPALDRRLAKLSDVSVNNVLWVDNAVAPQMRDGIESALMKAVKAPLASSDKATDTTIDYFIKEILPFARSMELLVRNTHAANFVTLTAPAIAGSAKLFKWDNGFGWSYDGNVTDSIREKVKRAGGNVDAALRFSLAWHNYDDLDLHCKTPSGEHIYFGDKQGRYGSLDVDMNAGYGQTREPVENIAFQRAPDGDYRVWVNQYARRETADTGFTVQIAEGQRVFELSCFQSPPAGDVEVGLFSLRNGVIVKHQFGPKMQGAGIPQTKWGVRTESMVKVQTVMASPNHWDGQQIGNKHWFFILEGCKVGEPMRGIYNEFLTSELEPHRKVFEVLGDKTRCEVADGQLSGLGFSSTRGDTVTVSVTSSDRSTRLFNILF